MSENANSDPNFGKSVPKFFLENQESYIPAAVQRAISEIKTIQSPGNGRNELAKIAAIRAILERPEVKEYFASLREKRALLLREFNLLNGANGGNINENVRARGDRLNAFIHILDTMKTEMNRSNVNEEKKKRFLRDLKILSTIHGNLQKELYPVLMEGKREEKIEEKGTAPLPPAAPAPAPEPSEPGAASPLTLNINSLINSQLSYSETTQLETILQSGIYVTNENEQNVNINPRFNNFQEGGFENQGGNDCYRNSSLHLLLTILKSFTLPNSGNSGLFKPENQNHNLKNFLLGLLATGESTQNTQPPYYTLSSGEGSGNRSNQRARFQPKNSRSQSVPGSAETGAVVVYQGTTQQDAQEYLNELLEHFFSERVTQKMNVETYEVKTLHVEPPKPFINISLLEIIPNFMNDRKNNYDLQDHIINPYLKHNIINIPDENEFILIELTIYRGTGNEDRIKKIFDLTSSTQIYIKNNIYQLNDVIYHYGDQNMRGGHYICHSFRNGKWIIYNDSRPVVMTSNSNTINYRSPSIDTISSNRSPTTLLLRRVRKIPLNSKPFKTYIDNIIDTIYQIFQYLNRVFEVSANQKRIIKKSSINFGTNPIPFYIGRIVGEPGINKTNEKTKMYIKKSIIVKLLWIIQRLNPTNNIIKTPLIHFILNNQADGNDNFIVVL